MAPELSQPASQVQQNISQICQQQKMDCRHNTRKQPEIGAELGWQIGQMETSAKFLDAERGEGAAAAMMACSINGESINAAAAAE